MSSFVFRFAQIFLFLIPFQFALAPVSGVDLPFTRVLAPTLFLVWFAVALARKKLDIPMNWTAAGLFVFLFFSLASLLYAERPEWAMRRALFLLSYLPLFLVFSSLVREHGPDGARRLLASFALGAGGAAIVGLFQFGLQFSLGVGRAFHYWIESVLPFFLGPGFAEAVAEYPSLLVDLGGTTMRASAFFPDPHMLAFFLGLALPVALGLSLSARHMGSRVLWFFMSLIIFAADILTFSRGGYVGLMLGLVGAVFLFWFGSWETGKRILFVAGIISVGVLGLVIDTPARDRLLSSFSLDEGSNEGRLLIFREAAEHIAARPLGYGLGNYPFAIKPSAEYREPIYALNLYLDIATEGGVIAALAFLVALIAAIIRLARRTNPILFRLGAISLVIFFGHSLFEMPLYSVHILPALCLFLALPAICDRIKS